MKKVSMIFAITIIDCISLFLVKVPKCRTIHYLDNLVMLKTEETVFCI